MKNKWSILLSSFITMIFVFTVGCTNKEYTADELYEDFKDQISKVSSYTCIAKVEAIGNKETLESALRIKYGIAWEIEKYYNYKVDIKSDDNISISGYDKKIKDIDFGN